MLFFLKKKKNVILFEYTEFKSGTYSDKVSEV